MVTLPGIHCSSSRVETQIGRMHVNWINYRVKGLFDPDKELSPTMTRLEEAYDKGRTRLWILNPPYCRQPWPEEQVGLHLCPLRG